MPELMVSMIRGKVGNVIVKHYDYGVVVSRVPDMTGIKPTKIQKIKRSRFKEAVAYAGAIIHNPEKKAAYKNTLRRGKMVYHAAIQEYLKKHP
jgi:hypothetical protein